jgi:MinD-like ATPase involved in chromosome partitioning or flagellar assembly
MSSEPVGESRTSHFSGAYQAAGYVEDSAPPAGLRAVGGGVATETAPASLPAEVVTAVEVNEEPERAVGAHAVPVTDAEFQAELAPEPLDDLAVISTIEKAPTATQGWRGLMSRLGLKMEPGEAEKQQLQAAAQLGQWETVIRQFVGTEAVGVLVANPKGSSGKTPTSIVLGGLLATIRGGSVAVLEVSDDRGTLSFRAEGNPSRGVAELVRDADGIRSAGQLAGYTAPQTSYASIIGSVGNRAPLTHDDVVAAARVIDEFYAIRVMDSGNQPTSSAFAGAIETTDALVVPVLNSADVVLEAVAMLDRLRSESSKGAQLANTAIIVRLIDGRPENPQLVARLDNIIDRAGVGGVFTIPYDPHIAERGQITLSKVSPATRAAFTAAAAAVVHTIQKNTK